MKKAKRLVSLLLAFVMLMSLAVSVGASGAELVNDKPVLTVTETLDDSATKAGTAADGTPYRGQININSAIYKEDYAIYQILYLDNVSEYRDPTTGLMKPAYSYVVNPEWIDFVLNAKDSSGRLYFKIEDYSDAEKTVPNHVSWNNTAVESNTEGAENFAKLALQYAKKTDGYTGTPITPNKKVTVNPSNVQETDETKDNYYTNYLYRVVLNNVGYGYYLLDSTVGALCSLSTAGSGVVDINEKNDYPTSDKKVYASSGYDSVNNADVGDIVYFKSELSVPYMITDLYFNDIMDTGLLFYNPDTDVVPAAGGASERHAKLTVTIMREGGTVATTLVENTHYQLITNAEGYTFRIKFLDDFYTYMKEPDDDGAVTKKWIVVVYYSAKLTKDAVDVADGITNKANITYGDKPSTTPYKITKTKTFKMNLAKYTGSLTNPTYLKDAKFKIYQQFGSTKPGDSVTYDFYTFYLESAGNDKDPAVYIFEGIAEKNPADEANKWGQKNATEIVTPESGKVIIKGISSGTYRIIETKAPDGFNPLRSALSVGIDSNGIVNYQGNLASDAFVMIKNNSGTELPETGGIGTTIFYIAGSVLLIGAVVLLIVKKRMSDEK